MISDSVGTNFFTEIRKLSDEYREEMIIDFLHPYCSQDLKKSNEKAILSKVQSSLESIGIAGYFFAFLSIEILVLPCLAVLMFRPL